MHTLSRRNALIPLLLPLSFAALSAADSITVDGVAYDDVYITESATRYYVQLPEEGRALSVAKDRVDPAKVQITADAARRAALRAQWKVAYGARCGPAEEPEPAVAPSPRAAEGGIMAIGPPKRRTEPIVITATSRERDDGQDPMSLNGMQVWEAELDGVRMGEGLEALLLGKGYDFWVYGSTLTVRPRKAAPAASKPFVRAPYTPRRIQRNAYIAAGDTLPKIVMRNPGGPGGPPGGLQVSNISDMFSQIDYSATGELPPYPTRVESP
ncbi:MAG: hypothetical protein JXR94_16925 [Candidatus Hydrogenedentes bacterium]|nr:hypothetical protein [Candidatus Hydrogenedentota bacterium]